MSWIQIGLKYCVKTDEFDKQKVRESARGGFKWKTQQEFISILSEFWSL